jgi:hypothetical protein
MQHYVIIKRVQLIMIAIYYVYYISSILYDTTRALQLSALILIA